MSDWRERAGRIVLDPLDPEGNELATPKDRRWLWRVESFLAVNATTEEQRRLASDLHAYLNVTCEHHWMNREAEQHIEAHRQCLWCNHVEWSTEVSR